MIDQQGLGVDFGLLRPTNAGHLYVVTRDLSEISLNVREMSPSVEGNKGTRIASDGKGIVPSVRMGCQAGARAPIEADSSIPATLLRGLLEGLLAALNLTTPELRVCSAQLVSTACLDAQPWWPACCRPVRHKIPAEQRAEIMCHNHSQSFSFNEGSQRQA